MLAAVGTDESIVGLSSIEMSASEDTSMLGAVA